MNCVLVRFVVLAVASCVLLQTVLADDRADDDGSPASDDADDGLTGPRLDRKACRCDIRRNWCTGKTGKTSIGCGDSCMYIQCINSVCNLSTCENGTLWNSSADACTPCSAGFHVDSKGRRCVCDEGTTWNSTTLECAKCPSGATILPDSCKCSRLLILDRTTNQCISCPDDARVDDGTCKCRNSSLFYNRITRKCEDCPGRWVPSGMRQVCQCGGAPYIFDYKAVSCFLCPAGTTARIYGRFDRADYCRCNIFGAVFEQGSGCRCLEGKAINMVTKSCERVRSMNSSETTTSTAQSTTSLPGGHASEDQSTSDTSPHPTSTSGVRQLP